MLVGASPRRAVSPIRFEVPWTEGLVAFVIWPGSTPVEDVIRRYMNDSVIKLFGASGQILDDVFVGPVASHFFFFGPVDGRIGGAVHHVAEVAGLHETLYSTSVGEVEVVAVYIYGTVA